MAPPASPWSQKIDKTQLPSHVAIIMDGNGRWAKHRGRPRLYGHQKGVESLKRSITFALEVGIPYLSVWAFSTANWVRPETEVTGLLNLLRHSLKKDLAEFHKAGIKLRVIGLQERLPKDLVALIENAVQVTEDNTKLTLNLVFNYDGRTDILKATRHLVEKVSIGAMRPEDITEETFSKHLLTLDLPDPDLLIRTSGVMRLSNFMMWQCAFTELVFLDKYWPDFTEEDFAYAICQFQKCERKFGQISA